MRVPAYFFCLMLTVLALASPTSAQQFRLPDAPGAWLNSAPITNDMLKGKAAILYYFEET